MTKAHESSRKLTKDHVSPREFTKIHVGSCEHTKAHEGTRRSTNVHEGLRKPTKVHEGLREHTKAHKGSRKSTRAHESSQRLTRAHKGPRKFEGLRRSTKIHEDSRRFTKVHEGPREFTGVYEDLNVVSTLENDRARVCRLFSSSRGGPWLARCYVRLPIMRRRPCLPTLADYVTAAHGVPRCNDHRRAASSVRRSALVSKITPEGACASALFFSSLSWSEKPARCSFQSANSFADSKEISYRGNAKHAEPRKTRFSLFIWLNVK